MRSPRPVPITIMTLAAFLGVIGCRITKKSSTFPSLGTNRGFEGGQNAAGFPNEWGGGGDYYDIGIDTLVAHSGQAAGSISANRSYDPSDLDEFKDSPFGTLTQCIPAAARGQKLLYSGYLKTEEVTHNGAGLWIRVDGPERAMLFLDNMRDRVTGGREELKDRAVRGTVDWAKYEISLEVPNEAERFCFGFLLAGNGSVWGDDLAFEAHEN